MPIDRTPLYKRTRQKTSDSLAPITRKIRNMITTMSSKSVHAFFETDLCPESERQEEESSGSSAFGLLDLGAFFSEIERLNEPVILLEESHRPLPLPVLSPIPVRHTASPKSRSFKSTTTNSYHSGFTISSSARAEHSSSTHHTPLLFSRSYSTVDKRPIRKSKSNSKVIVQKGLTLALSTSKVTPQLATSPRFIHHGTKCDIVHKHGNGVVNMAIE